MFTLDRTLYEHENILAIRHEVMFMRDIDEDFPTCKLRKLGDPTGEGMGR